MSPDVRPDTSCGVTLQQPCPFNRIGDRQVGYACIHHQHRRCSGFTGGYDDALYTCACGCHASPETSCGRCAWCLKDPTPRQRGYELVCPHGYGCCRNCQTCCPARQSPAVAPVSLGNPRSNG